MRLIVGLGNPGAKYGNTRHNVGFVAVERIAEALSLEFREKDDYLICSGSIGDEKISLMEPLTFMNRSGAAVARVMRKSNIAPEDVIVIHDDLDLPPGKLKIRKNGSSGGHNGVESIIQCIGSREFIRVKIGIGRNPLVPVEVYVLSKFSREEQPVIKEAVKLASDAVECIISEGVDKAMNRFNKS